MPVLIWSGIASIAGVIAGIIYEKESNKKVVVTVASAATGGNETRRNCYDKALMAAAGIAAYWIYRSTK